MPALQSANLQSQRLIKFLGHIVGADGIKVNLEKIAAVEDWPAPTNVHKLRSFLGLANYFRKFIQGYAKFAAPLTELTKAKHPQEDF
jgi:hypothetical protein